MSNYVRLLRRYDAINRAYFRAREAYLYGDFNRYDSIYSAITSKRAALRAEIKAYVARPSRVSRDADDVARGGWLIERGKYLIRRQQVQTACRLLGIDSRELRF